MTKLSSERRKSSLLGYSFLDTNANQPLQLLPVELWKVKMCQPCRGWGFALERRKINHKGLFKERNGLDISHQGDELGDRRRDQMLEGFRGHGEREVAQSCPTLCNLIDCTLLKGCCWITWIHRDYWPPEEKNSIRGQRRGLIAQSFCVIKFY